MAAPARRCSSSKVPPEAAPDAPSEAPSEAAAEAAETAAEAAEAEGQREPLTVGRSQGLEQYRGPVCGTNIKK